MAVRLPAPMLTLALAPPLALALALVLASCGSKTPLRVSPSAPADAGFDAPVDAAPDTGSTTAPLCSSTDADVVIVYEDGRLSQDRVDLRARVRIPQADVYFLIDTTGSMVGELRAMRDAVIRLIDELTCPTGGAVCSGEGDCADDEACSPEGRCGPAPEIAGCLPDLHVGVGTYAGATSTYRHRADVQPPGPAVSDAIPDFPDGFGGAEALYESVGCATGFVRCFDAGCAVGRGCPGFRPRALPILVTITDEGDECLYSWGLMCSVTAEQAGQGLMNLGATFVGIDADVGMEATPFLVELAESSRSYDEAGEPLVFGGVDGDVVDAVRRGLRAVTGSALDLSVAVEDEADDDGDALAFVGRVEIDGETAGCFDYDDVEDVDGDGVPDTVRDAGPGTTGCFELVLAEPRLAPSDEPRMYRMTARLLGDGAVVDEVSVCVEVR